MSAAGGEVPKKLMTIRISRDGGRTYGEPIEITANPKFPPGNSRSGWPPCQCPKHRAAQAEGRTLPHSVRLRSDGS